VPATEIRTERLLLRGWRAADLAPFADLNADPVVMEFFPAPLSRAESDAFAGRISETLERQGWGLWAVEVHGEFVGFTGLAVPRFDAPFMPAVEIGWRLARPAWGRGYATEAARAVIDHAFAAEPAGLGLDELVSFTSVGNLRSRRVMEHLGMTHDPRDDFDHPLVGEGHPLRRHVLHRLRSEAVTSATIPKSPSPG
jgi:ribosomal-protein-alanine N-acetyltransferase